MRSTQDCDDHLSREHFISASVLSHLGGRNVSVKGLPWLKGDDTKILPISSLTGKILCKRHNEAFSPLDDFAGQLIDVVDNSINRQTLSRKDRWYLISGEELELWLLKTAIGLFHSGSAAKNKSTLSDSQIINPVCYDASYRGGLVSPCGLYVDFR
jgi:hypothetical protein